MIPKDELQSELKTIQTELAQLISQETTQALNAAAAAVNLATILQQKSLRLVRLAVVQAEIEKLAAPDKGE